MRLKRRAGCWRPTPHFTTTALETLSTVHANSAAQGISRFTTCVLQSGVEMPYLAIKANIAESLNAIVQIERRPGLRFISHVLEIRGYDREDDRYELFSLYSRKCDGTPIAPLAITA